MKIVPENGLCPSCCAPRCGAAGLAATAAILPGAVTTGRRLTLPAISVVFSFMYVAECGEDEYWLHELSIDSSLKTCPCPDDGKHSSGPTDWRRLPRRGTSTGTGDRKLG
jgi:hypothetical protein